MWLFWWSRGVVTRVPCAQRLSRHLSAGERGDRGVAERTGGAGGRGGEPTRKLAAVARRAGRRRRETGGRGGGWKLGKQAERERACSGRFGRGVSFCLSLSNALRASSEASVAETTRQPQCPLIVASRIRATGHVQRCIGRNPRRRRCSARSLQTAAPRCRIFYVLRNSLLSAVRNATGSIRKRQEGMHAAVRSIRTLFASTGNGKPSTERTPAPRKRRAGKSDCLPHQGA